VDSPLVFLKNPKGEVAGFVMHYRGLNLKADKLK
jgi:hypothetical protein